MHRLSFNRLVAALATVAMLGIGIPLSIRAEAFPPLNNPPTTQQLPGKFVWADLFTSEPAAAATFYCSLLGWTAVPVERKNRSYLVLSNGDHPVAGIVLRSAPAAKHRSVWIGYISVAKARAALEAVKAAGGKERAPVHNFPNRGREAIFSDPEGSVVGILQSSSGDPIVDEPQPGDWSWFELFSQNPREAAGFYQRAFGYEVTADPRPGKSDHRFLASSGRTWAGVAPHPSMDDCRSGWLGCVRVADLDTAVAKAVTLGGAVVVAPQPAALGSRFAVITDPTGGAIGLVQYLDNANPEGRP